MSSLSDVLKELRDNISKIKQSGGSIGEDNTKAALIEPLLASLGWDTTDLDVVHRQYKRGRQSKPVDYALLINGKPILFIEAKALEKNLSDIKWIRQTLGYAENAGLKWCILTNGEEYHIYRSNIPIPLEKKLYKKISISDKTKLHETLAILELLSKENLKISALDSLWDTYFTKTSIREALKDCLQNPPRSLVTAIREKTNLKPSRIRAFLNDARIHVEIPETPTQVKSVSLLKPKKSINGYGHIKVKTLIAKGIIKPPLQIFTTYHGKRLEAFIERDGYIVFGGKRYQSLSLAGGYARNSVIGPPKDERKFYHTNGWTFWKTKDEKGNVIEIHEFRVRASKL